MGKTNVVTLYLQSKYFFIFVVQMANFALRRGIAEGQELELQNFKIVQKMNKEQNVEGLNVRPYCLQCNVVCSGFSQIKISKYVR